jgi:hypothetical protein
MITPMYWTLQILKDNGNKHDTLHCTSIFSAAIKTLLYSGCWYQSLYLTNTQEVNTHSAAPSKCIHSSDQKCNMDRTSTSRQNVTSKYHATLLRTFICRHEHASPEAGATGPSQHANRCSVYKEIPPTQTHTQLSQSAIHK